MGNKNEKKKKNKEKKTNQGSLNRTHWIFSISAVFESLPLSPSEIRSDGKHDFWSDYIGRVIGKSSEPKKSWLDNKWNNSSKRISMILHEFLTFLIFFYYTIMFVELSIEFCYKLNHNCFIRETEKMYFLRILNVGT